MTKTKTVNLSQDQVKSLKIQLIQKEMSVMDWESKKKTMEHRLQTNFLEKSLDWEIEKMEDSLKSGKDEGGNKLPKFLLDDLENQINIKKEQRSNGTAKLQEKNARKNVIDLDTHITREKKNIKVLKEQIRTKKAKVTE